VLDIFGISPDFDLNLMRGNQSLTELTTKVLCGMRDLYRQWRPDLVLVQGDTTTTFAASLAAFYEKLPVGHIEAGLRTGNPYSPWPEEINRCLTTVLCQHHFAPTTWARENLISEGVNPESVIVTGNTVIDALKGVLAQIEKNESLRSRFDERFSFLDKRRRLILVTGHRRENFGDGFERICRALKKLAERGDLEILYPVHLNPNVREPVDRILAGISNIHLIEPQEYLPFAYLLTRSYLIITDSGGIQEEAPYLGKPVLLMRDTTERPEALESGTVKLVGTEIDSIVRAACELLDDEGSYQEMAKSANPYGDGTAASKIVQYVKSLKGIEVTSHVF